MPAPPLLEAVPAGEILDLIAYSDRIGRVFVTSPGGGQATRIDPDGGFFSWPILSPTGEYIVFSGIPGTAGDPLELYAYRLGDDRARVIFTNERRAGPILPDMAHYPLWAPDGGRLALIASTERRLTLFLTGLGDGEAAEVVLEQAPLYLSWSGDSRHMVVHGGAEHFLVDVGEETTVTNLGDSDVGYRVPAWWPTGDRYALVSEGKDGRRALFVAEAYSEKRTLLEAVRGGAAFLWSPDGQRLAVGQSKSVAGGIVYDTVGLFLADGTKIGMEIRDDVVAFYWSPDSQKLAYVVLGDVQGALGWKVLDVADGTRQTVVEFEPSSPQLTMFQFFDQFAYSHTTWSPDSDALVFAGRLVGDAVSLSEGIQPASRIIVATLEPVPSARAIADGLMAFWSPR